MKRIFSSLLVVTLLIAALSLSAAATGYTGTYDYDFSAKGAYSKILASSATVTVTASCSYPATTHTTTTVAFPKGCTGRVTSGVLYNLQECRTADSNTIVNNQVTCTAYLQNHSTVTKTYHYANRSYNSTMDCWQYYFVDPDHPA